MIEHTEQRGKYTINLELLPEEEAPDWGFDTEEEKNALYKEIDSGNLLWFVAKVTTVLDGVTLATDYLGGCCYKSVADFVSDPYYESMAACAIAESEVWLSRNADVTE